MPRKPLHPCPGRGTRYHRCPNLVRSGLCPECQSLEDAARKAYDRQRDQTQEWRKWIHSVRWRKATKIFKNRPENVLCAECLSQGRHTPTYLVDHIIPHNGDYYLFWEESNWKGLCNPCHEAKHKGERWRK